MDFVAVNKKKFAFFDSVGFITGNDICAALYTVYKLQAVFMIMYSFMLCGVYGYAEGGAAYEIRNFFAYDSHYTSPPK